MVKDRTLSREQLAAAVVGALSALVVAVVVTRLASAYLDDQPIVGFLLVLGAILLVVVGFDLWSPVRRGGMWSLGAGCCLALTAAYAVSATVGLPDGSDTQPWWDTWVAAGILAESLYVVAMAVWLAAGRTAAGRAGISRRPARPASSSR